MHEFWIARALALQVRMLTVNQIARVWFSDSEHSPDAANDALARLELSGLVESRLFEAHPVIRLTQPLFAWNPGEPPPSSRQLEALAEISRSRWKKQQVPVRTYSATKAGARIFGAFSDSRHAKHCEATHDIHLSEVFARYCSKLARQRVNWWGEAAFPKLGFEIKGMKDPDAFLLDNSGCIRRVVEFSGVYSAEHLGKFHAHCAGRAAENIARRYKRIKSSTLARLYAPGGTSYELW